MAAHCPLRLALTHVSLFGFTRPLSPPSSLSCRFVAEEYILDTMVALEGSRVHCIKRLVSGLPLEKGWEHQALLAEVLLCE